MSFTLTEAEKWRGYARARKFPTPGRCDQCGSDGGGRIERHHKDHNPLNNVIANIAFLCRACHCAQHRREDLDERCPKGHLWTDENTYYYLVKGRRTVTRRCQACRRVRQNAYRARMRAAA